MASLAYVTIPPGATRLEGNSSTRRAKKVLTSLPNPSSVPGTSTNAGSLSSPGSGSTGITSPSNAAFAILPQLLFSSSVPPSSPGAKDKDKHTTSGNTPNTPTLLTNRDPLSLPITSANFRRFVTKSGPIFWLQDRIEEVIMWRRGWKVTCFWMAVYAFLCYYPNLLFAVPHVTLIGIILASYPYPDQEPLSPKSSSTFTPPPPSLPESGSWHANLQAIQNLMGFVADAYDLIQPHTHLLALSPAHFQSPLPHSVSPYPLYILLTLLLSLPPLLLLLASSFFPTRLFFFLAGVGPLLATHPRIKPQLALLSHLSAASAFDFAQALLNVVVQRYRKFQYLYLRLRKKWKPSTKTQTSSVDEKGWLHNATMVPLVTMLERIRDDDRLDDVCWRSEMREVELWENERYKKPQGAQSGMHSKSSSEDSISSPSAQPDEPEADRDVTLGSPPPKDPSMPESSSLHTTEPEFLGLFSSFSSTSSTPVKQAVPKHHHLIPLPIDPGWSKANLLPGERRAWTRGRDGWGGISPQIRRSGNGSDGGSSGERKDRGDSSSDGYAHEASEGFVSSNLTFSLAPGWAFVETEGWRRDLTQSWAEFDDAVTPNINMDGWVYTNDVWDDAQPTPFPRSVTRRRRWVRRIWFDGTYKEGEDEKMKS